MMKPLIFGFLSCFLLFACSEKEKVNNPAAPVIGVLSITPDSLIQFQDSAFVTIQYEDINGDIGSIDPDVNDLEIKDSRLSTADLFHIQPLSPDGKELFIRGQIKVKLNSLFLLGNGDYESVNFTIRLRDQKGDWSTSVTTDAIVIKRQ